MFELHEGTTGSVKSYHARFFGQPIGSLSSVTQSVGDKQLSAVINKLMTRTDCSSIHVDFKIRI